VKFVITCAYILYVDRCPLWNKTEL